MKPVEFPEVNTKLTRPSSMTDEECSSLPVHRTPDGCCISCWELSGEELMEVLRTKRVWVRVWSGQSQPPIGVETESPFEPAAGEGAGAGA